jgi:hypothetical protein
VWSRWYPKNLKEQLLHMTLHPMEVSLHISSSDERLKTLDLIDSANISQYLLLDSFWWIGDGTLGGFSRFLKNVHIKEQMYLI